eukprot:TRINITY_DN9769_c0_g1_i1.p2 TRINITY_DN9769_c0_g1~~TRINITY_DN9769_c0_g1_i1.p2  ORF type:complete len:113 (+),score=24.11 TRINITY_DN9769_c0_g1_i1:128-466(+)
MIRRPPRSTHCISSAASDVYKRQINAEYMGIMNRVVIMMLHINYNQVSLYSQKLLGKSFDHETTLRICSHIYLVLSSGILAACSGSHSQKINISKVNSNQTKQKPIMTYHKK